MSRSSVPNGVALRFRKISELKARNTGLLVLVTRSDTVRMLYNIFTSIYRPIAQHYQIVNSVEKAYFLIAEAREKRKVKT